MQIISVIPYEYKFLVIKDNNKFYWFEHSWYDERGIHEYQDLNELFNEQKDLFIINENYSLLDTAFYICRGGWPLSLVNDRNKALKITSNYCSTLFEFENSKNNLEDFMKMLKKFLVAAVVLIASCAAAFAFDSSNIIEMEKIDNVSRKEFEQLFGDQDAIDEFIDEMITEMRTDEFAVTSMGLIDVDQIDDEDEELLELIADGARILLSAEDVISEVAECCFYKLLSIGKKSDVFETFNCEDSNSNKVLEQLRVKSLTADELVRLTSISYTELSVLLSELEIKGDLVVERGKYSLTR
mgnify:CR=1 FL=1